MSNIVPVVLVKNDEYFLPYALESTRGFFSRYVIYDINSTDRTRDIIQWFVSTNPTVEFLTRMLPECPPIVQGCFRNAQIAEAQSELYMILDGDEIWTPESLTLVVNSPKIFNQHNNALYGVVRRIEIGASLIEAYGVKNWVPHHRLYRRQATWLGSHPGEYPYISQNQENEIYFRNIQMYHFHNCSRSSKDALVPKRIERRGRATYHPGELSSINILDTLPILKQKIENFPINPQLQKLLDEQ